jgi:phospholipid/cholesterol/gamma-HCH transport system permease protein
MNPDQPQISEVSKDGQKAIELSGRWIAVEIADVIADIDTIRVASKESAPVILDASKISRLDSAGAWALLRLIERLGRGRAPMPVTALPEKFSKLLEAVEKNIGNDQTQASKLSVWGHGGIGLRLRGATEKVGTSVLASLSNSLALLSFCGETALAFAACVIHPARLRVRPVLFNVRTAGFDALPIVGLLSLLLGVVVAYQSADQLRNFGASIFVADIVGLSMVREFSPLIVAIIIAGRSGSAYAAQIGTMAVTEELDSLNTLGVSSIELLVIPKVLALAIAMPLLTVYSDVLGVFGGMLMANQQLGIGFAEFSDRLVKAVSVTAFMTGLGKVPVFAIVIAMVSCFQGFKTKGGADSVGRQTTKSVVQSIFWVIVVDAIFSVAFNALDL